MQKQRRATLSGWPSGRSVTTKHGEGYRLGDLVEAGRPPDRWSEESSSDSPSSSALLQPDLGSTDSKRTSPSGVYRSRRTADKQPGPVRRLLLLIVRFFGLVSRLSRSPVVDKNHDASPTDENTGGQDAARSTACFIPSDKQQGNTDSCLPPDHDRHKIKYRNTILILTGCPVFILTAMVSFVYYEAWQVPVIDEVTTTIGQELMPVNNSLLFNSTLSIHASDRTSKHLERDMMAILNILFADSFNGAPNHNMTSIVKATRGSPLTYSQLRTSKYRSQKHTTIKSRKAKTCASRFCQAQLLHLQPYLNWSADPCDNFFGFVCSSRTSSSRQFELDDTMLLEHVEDKLYQSIIKGSNIKRAATKPGKLLQQCIGNISSKLSDSILKQLFAGVGLEHWPYQSYKDHINVWSVAANLLRQFQLPTIMTVDLKLGYLTIRGPVIVLGEPDFDQYRANPKGLAWGQLTALTFAFKKFSKGEDFNYVAGVRDFILKLSNIMSLHRQKPFQNIRYSATKLSKLSLYRTFLEHVFVGIFNPRNDTPVLLVNADYVNNLKSLFQTSELLSVLNYFGFRLFVHLAPFLSDDYKLFSDLRMTLITGRRQAFWPRWKRCLHVLEPLMPSFYLQSYARDFTIKVNETRLKRLVNRIKFVLNLKIGTLTWMTDTDKEKSRTVLNNIQLKYFQPGFTKILNVGDMYKAFPPLQSDILNSYKAYAATQLTEKYQQVIKKKNLQGLWVGSVFDTQPSFDLASRTIFIPMAMIFPDFGNSTASLLRLPSVITKIASALMLGIYEGNRINGLSRWTKTTTSKLDKLVKCLRNRFTSGLPDLMVQPDRSYFVSLKGFLNNVAIATSLEVFWKMLRDNYSIDFKDTGYLEDKGIDIRHLYFLLYSSSLCSSGDTSAEYEDGLSNTMATVSILLKNLPVFDDIWKCGNKRPPRSFYCY